MARRTSGTRHNAIATSVVAALIGATLTTTLTIGLGADPGFAALQTDIIGPAGSGFFGNQILVLSNGNFVIADPRFDQGGLADVGAVRLYDGTSHALISTLTGTTADDRIGTSLVEVGSSNVAVGSALWDNGSAANAGAVTWMDGRVGLNGSVSASNSIVGSHAGDSVGGGQFATQLSNQNYVVVSNTWDNGLIADAGAIRWADGDAPTGGAISSANSLVGSTAGDGVGASVMALTNGNFVAVLDAWDNGGITDAGAATWGNGTDAGPRTFGVVSTVNSLHGSTNGDRIGRNGVAALTGGAYVVASPLWDRAGAADAGAATWGNGSGGTTGPITTGNSLVGVVVGDQVAGGGVTPLGTGSYVVASPSWRRGGLATAGAATLLAGTAAFGGTIDAVNSLVGDTADDQVGQMVLALTNGNYVVASSGWDAGGVADAGAVTWGEGHVGVHGSITAGNSLVGTSTGDGVGNQGVVALTNGNYVVQSILWDGSAANVGAATWGAGGGGTVGAVSASNSLVGANANDFVGYRMLPLANGNYVITSENWSGNLGAVTWGNGNTPGGVHGQVSAANSLVGSAAGDQIGGLSVGGSTSALVNSDYVVLSPGWDNGVTVDAGAATWGSGTFGSVGVLSAANSLVGTSTNQKVAQNVTGFADGSFVAITSATANGSIANAGAATYVPVGGANGPITAARNVSGTVANGISFVGNRLTTDGSIVISRQASNIVTLFHPDTTAPSFAGSPAAVSVTVGPGATSAVVVYAVPHAFEDVGIATVVCVPPPGSVFPLGVTTVTCTATNTEAMTATTSFTVTVSAGTDYLALSPARLADSRPDGVTVDGQFAAGGLRPAGSTLELVVAGRGGVPTDAVAATMNVTVTEAGADGFLTVYPCGSAQPTASNLNYVTGGTIPNAVITKIGAGGAICIYTLQAVHLVVDVNGAFPPSTTYAAINPARVLDTRAIGVTVDGMQQSTGAAAAGSVTTLQINGRAGVPVGAAAVVLNVTVTEPTAAGYATVYPCGTEPPTASNLNYTPGLTIPNLVIAKIGNGGAVCIFTQSTTELVADVLGYFPTGTTFTALVPSRLLDTRPPTQAVAGAGVQPAGTVTAVHVLGRGGVPAAASTAVLNVTVTEPGSAGFVTVYPCGSTPGTAGPPLASNLNFVGGQTIPNAVITRIGAGGDICVFNSQATHLVVDVTGFFP